MREKYFREKVVEVPPEIHKKLKILSFEYNVNMKTLAAKIFILVLEDENLMRKLQEDLKNG